MLLDLSSDPIIVRGSSLPNDLESRKNESHDNHNSSCDSHQTKSISVSRVSYEFLIYLTKLLIT